MIVVEVDHLTADAGDGQDHSLGVRRTGHHQTPVRRHWRVTGGGGGVRLQSGAAGGGQGDTIIRHGVANPRSNHFNAGKREPNRDSMQDHTINLV